MMLTLNDKFDAGDKRIEDATATLPEAAAIAAANETMRITVCMRETSFGFGVRQTDPGRPCSGRYGRANGIWYIYHVSFQPVPTFPKPQLKPKHITRY